MSAYRVITFREIGRRGMIEPSSLRMAGPHVGQSSRLYVIVLALLPLLVIGLALLGPRVALAGQASSGELFFFPCTSCHPVTMTAEGVPAKKLPNGFKGHDIVLVGHDKLGRGTDACLACHDDPSRDPGKLRLADGTLMGIQDDIAQVCFRCHSDKYKEFKAGTHGNHKPSCVAAGCHDPHTPGFIYADALRPFVGNGFQFQVLSQRDAFMPLASPAVPPPVSTPAWFTYAVGLGLVVVGGLTGTLVFGRLKR